MEREAGRRQKKEGTSESVSLLSYLRPYWFWAVLAPASMAVEVSMDLTLPRLVQHIVDDAIPKGDSQLILHYGLAMGLAALTGIVTGAGCGLAAVRASQGFGADLRRALYSRIQSLSFSSLDRLETGSLITRLTNDVTQVQDIVLMVLRGMVRAPLLLAGGLVMSFMTSPRLALLFLFLVPVVLGFMWFVVRRTYPIYREVQRRLDSLNERLQENLSGVRVVKAFCRAEHEEERFGAANQRLKEGAVAAARYGAATGPFMMAVVNMGVIAALWFGGSLVVRGEMSVGQIVAFVSYLTLTLNALMFVSMLVTQLSRAGASADRIKEIFAEEQQIVPPARPILPPKAGGKVVFEDVSFGYGDGEDVLHGISLSVEAGKFTAIVGATGAGKSSLVSLIPRFYDPVSGRITLDGQDLRDFEELEIRRRVSIAFQLPILFSGTVRENILSGRPGAGEAEMREAARTAQAEEFIERLPDGYETKIGQRGVNLSGGQKQRLAIARALLSQAEVLILDDCTSAVDVHTEARIQEGLASSRRDQTRIVVVQRVHGILHADEIIVLDEGRVAGRGRHQQLLEACPLYREIYESQTRAAEESRAV